MLARAVAGEANKRPFYSLSASESGETVVGVGASRVRDLFEQAKNDAPSIIVIDGLDAIGRSRTSGAMSGSNDEREQTLAVSECAEQAQRALAEHREQLDHLAEALLERETLDEADAHAVAGIARGPCGRATGGRVGLDVSLKNNQQKGKAMSHTQSKTSSRSLRDRAPERFVHADAPAQETSGLGEPPNGPMPAGPGLGLGPVFEKVASYWWLELLLGVFWVVVSVVVLKFNQASVTTVGILTGLMFLLFAAQESVLAAVDRPRRWLWAIFSVLLAASGIVALIHPTATFAGFADILGFVFLLIGAMWMVQAFTERPVNSLWWLTLISGIMMTVLAFWVSGQFFVVRAYTLLIFAGIWAMTTGIIDIVRAFQIREVGQELGHHPRR